MAADTGRLEEMKSVTPKDFGQNNAETQVIGKYVISEGMKPEEFIVQRDRLYHLYDVLMPVYVAGRPKVSEECKQAAVEFKNLFFRLTEPPLRPYYLSEGKDFLTWVDRVGSYVSF